MTVRINAAKRKGEFPDANGAIWSLFVAACFFISGAAGLVYEVIWGRLIDKVIGSAPFAAAFMGCALVLIVPTGLMGATLPVLCRYFVLCLAHIGTQTGKLYGLNTVGAAVGVVLCGFVLIKSL